MRIFPFDQYQRYKNAANIINEMRKPGEIFNILEVGSNEHCNLEILLPNDSIKYLDIQFPEKFADNPKYILGDATQMVFGDNEFDIVIAVDVFEHIPTERRDQFIKELHRVSSEFFVLTAPFDSPAVNEAEQRVNAIYKSLLKEDYIWLNEHFTGGLPDQKRLEQLLNTHGIQFCIWQHGQLEVWESLTGVHFIAAYHSDLSYYRAQIDKFYNEHLFDKDFSEHSYRKIFVCSKSRKINDEIIQRAQYTNYLNETDKDLMKLRQLINNFLMLASSKGTSLSIRSDIPEYRDRIQVFIDTGKGFNEEQSASIEVLERRLVTYFSMKCIDFGPVKAVRIDPSNYEGAFRIENLKVIDFNHNLITDFDLYGNYTLQIDNVLVFNKIDPHIHIELKSEIVVDSIEFNVITVSNDFSLLVNEFEKEILKQIVIHNQRMAEIEKKYVDYEKKMEILNNQLSERDLLLNQIYNSKLWKISSKIKKITRN